MAKRHKIVRVIRLLLHCVGVKESVSSSSSFQVPWKPVRGLPEVVLIRTFTILCWSPRGWSSPQRHAYSSSTDTTPLLLWMSFWFFTTVASSLSWTETITRDTVSCTHVPGLFTLALERYASLLPVLIPCECVRERNTVTMDECSWINTPKWCAWKKKMEKKKKEKKKMKKVMDWLCHIVFRIHIWFPANVTIVVGNLGDV